MKKRPTRILASILAIAVMCSVLSISVIAANSSTETVYLNPGVNKIERSRVVCTLTKTQFFAGVYIDAIAGPATIWLESEDGKYTSSKVKINVDKMGSVILLNNPRLLFGGPTKYRVVVENRYLHNNPMCVRVAVVK